MLRFWPRICTTDHLCNASLQYLKKDTSGIRKTLGRDFSTTSRNSRLSFQGFVLGLKTYHLTSLVLEWDGTVVPKLFVSPILLGSHLSKTHQVCENMEVNALELFLEIVLGGVSSPKYGRK